MDGIFRPGDQERIRAHYGEAFLQKVLRDIAAYAGKWALSGLRFIPCFSANCIFTGVSGRYGEIVAKLSQRLNLPEAVVMKGFYIDRTMGACWSVENDTVYGRCKKLCDSVAFVRALLDRYKK